VRRGSACTEPLPAVAFQVNGINKLEERRAYARLYGRRQRAMVRVLLSRGSWCTIPEHRELRRHVHALMRGERPWVIRTLAERASVSATLLAAELRAVLVIQTSERRARSGGSRMRWSR
jgi:hypothetical protein